MHEAAERSSLGPLAEHTRVLLREFEAISLAQRLAAADSSLWSDAPEVRASIDQRLGWVGAAFAELEEGIAAAEGDVMLLGMGGSSLGGEACARAFGAAERLRVVDSTVPGAVLGADAWLADVTDVVVASKSGGTVETAALADYFEARCDRGVRFHAVTDPGSDLESHAAARGYASCHLNAPDIGGRFSVLSRFGSVPLGLAGVDVDGIRQRGSAMAARCSAPVADNPGLWLGAVLAAAAAAGRDKILLLPSPGLEGLADWIEQLVAESTGKDGMGLVPVTQAKLDGSVAMATDRTIVLLEWSEDPRSHEHEVAGWVTAGVPVVRLEMAAPCDIGAELYRWQVAVATVGVALGINPFDEPNVASAKRRTGEMLRAAERAGGLPMEHPDRSGDRVHLFASGAAGASALEILARVVRPADGGYLGLLAYLPRNPSVQAALDTTREALRGPNPVTVGWGPRYLHSSGQLHKGGPPTGRFLMLTAEDGEDVEIPGRPWTFGTLSRAQALGDALALEESGRTVVRAHLEGELGPAIAELVELLHRTLELDPKKRNDE